ncbi:hypothetical protein BH23PAT1_BH23PAT1_2920 [soil metagenome]
MSNNQEVKSVKKWVLLLFLPLLFLVIVALLQIIVRFALTNSAGLAEGGLEAPASSPITSLINVFSLLIGSVSVVLILLIPLWLFLIVRDLKGHERKKIIAVILAIFFAHFSWIYTYEKNVSKFWINFVLSLLSAGVWLPVAWLWAVIDNASKTEEYYAGYHTNETVQPVPVN